MQQPDSGSQSEAADAPARILVIDDEEVVHVSLRRMLGRRGHQVEAVFGAQAGLELLESGHFDLVITDLMMPEIDGIGLIKRLKQRQIEVPVLMITGYPTIRTALQALRLGAVDYLAKPFTRQELLGPVNRALRSDDQEGAPTQRPITEEVRAATEPASDDGIDAPKIDLRPGDRVELPRHSWAVFGQDGSMEIGIVRSFIGSVGKIVSIELPSEAEIVEQGYVGIRLRTSDGEEHGAFMPVSGPVVALNSEVEAAPSRLDADTWLVRVIPNRLDRELNVLVRKEGRSEA